MGVTNANGYTLTDKKSDMEKEGIRI